MNVASEVLLVNVSVLYDPLALIKLNREHLKFINAYHMWPTGSSICSLWVAVIMNNMCVQTTTYI